LIIPQIKPGECGKTVVGVQPRISRTASKFFAEAAWRLFSFLLRNEGHLNHLCPLRLPT
jgi:hypothetical protein